MSKVIINTMLLAAVVGAARALSMGSSMSIPPTKPVSESPAAQENDNFVPGMAIGPAVGGPTVDVKVKILQKAKDDCRVLPSVSAADISQAIKKCVSAVSDL